ncbi:hypothetical protein KCU95_g4399, partial [Aureobasidium melanogenum]
MQFTIIAALALAANAFAAPVEQAVEGQVLISLPPGCTKTDLAKCAFHLIGTTASCGAAIIEVGANPAADLSCIGSAAGTAANFGECKSCIPKKTDVIEN